MKLLLILLFCSVTYAANDEALRRVKNGLNAIETTGTPAYKTCSQIIDGNNYGRDPRYQVSLKNYPNPSRGCFDKNTISDEEATELIASQNFITVGATNSERKTLAAAIKRVQELNGGVLEVGKGATSGGFPWNYIDSNGSIWFPSHIEIGRNIAKRRNRNYAQSVAQHVHEWAHLMGNQGVYTAFQSYMNPSGYGESDYCMVSNYADNTTGEQFAEVLAAFITEPRILLNNSRTPKNCEKAFQFLWNFFPNGHLVQNCL